MLKIIFICILFGIICYFIKTINKTVYPFLLIACSCLIIFLSFEYLQQIIDFFLKLKELSSIDDDFFSIIFKLIGIAIIIEFGSGLLNDIGQTELSNKLIFFGKIILIFTSLPVFYYMLTFIQNLLEI